MNDRFKFRAWDKILSFMVYQNSDFRKLNYLRREKQNYFNVYSKSEWYPAREILGIFDYFDSILEDQDFILMQCTGLKDKNGKLIFEGDIIDATFKYEVIFKNGCFLCKVRDSQKTILLIDFLNLRHGAVGGSEIVGNIYENSELVNQKN